MSVTDNSPPRSFGVTYPVRKARMLLSGLTLVSMLYFFGSMLFLIPAFFFVSAYGSWGWLLTLLLLSGIIVTIAYRGYRRQRDALLADAQKVTPDESPELARTLEFLQAEARSREMEAPDLYVHPAMSVNAFAIGRRNSGHIVLLEGLIASLEEEEELRAIVAHELAHIDNRDSMLMSLLSGIKEAIVQFWAWAGFAGRKWMYERRGVVLTPTEEQALMQKSRRRSELVCSPIGLCEKSISRHREYIADAEAARATRPEAIIGALKSIDDSDLEPQEIDVAQSLCIHGRQDGLLSRIRSTHPSVEKRIQSVQKHFSNERPVANHSD